MLCDCWSASNVSNGSIIVWKSGIAIQKLSGYGLEPSTNVHTEVTSSPHSSTSRCRAELLPLSEVSARQRDAQRATHLGQGIPGDGVQGDTPGALQLGCATLAALTGHDDLLDGVEPLARFDLPDEVVHTGHELIARDEKARIDHHEEMPLAPVGDPSLGAKLRARQHARQHLDHQRQPEPFVPANGQQQAAL